MNEKIVQVGMLKTFLAYLVLSMLFLSVLSVCYPLFNVKPVIVKAEPDADNWYVISNGWINVTKNNYKWAAKNGSVPNEYMFYYRYSNKTAFQSVTFGFIWTEDGTATYKGYGTAYLIYNDSDVLIYKRVQDATNSKIVQYYTFWKDKEYFAWESELTVKNNIVILQHQVGIYMKDNAGETYDYRAMDYKNGSYLSGTTNLPVTIGAIENNKALPWQVMKCTNRQKETVGWIAVYHSQPWLGISAGLGANAELQYSSYHMNPKQGSANRLPYVSYTKRIATIVYPYYGDDANWHLPTKQLAEKLYSTVTKSQSFSDLLYAFAQHDTTSLFRTGQIANRIGVYLIGDDNLRGGFLLKNTTVWNWYPSTGAGGPLPIVFKRANVEEPHVIITNSSGEYYVRSDTAPTKLDASSQSISKDSTKVWLSIQFERKEFLGNMTLETWGDSDKFNVTLRFKTKIATKIRNAYTQLTLFDQINAIQFTEIKTNVVADYVIQDPYGGYCGYLVKYLEGDGKWVDFENGYIRIYFIDNTVDQQYSANQVYTMKLMFWAHYGQITSESQITGYHTNQTINNIRQHFANSPANPMFYTPYDVWNASASFPIMKQISSTAYNLTAIASGTKTFTIFLNKTIFPSINNVVGVTSWNYNAANGNLTFTATFSSVKQIQIQTQPQTPINKWQMTFNHRDKDNNIVDSWITWQLYNGSQLLSYTEGQYTLLDGTYTLKTHYHAKLINQTSLPTATYGNTTINILLQMKAHTSVTNGYIAFNNTISSITVNSQTSTNLTVTVAGSSPVWIIADVPRNLTYGYVQRNGVNQSGWVFDASTSPNYVHLNASTLSKWEFYFPAAPALNKWQMTFNHLDKDSNVVDSKITWKLYNGSQLLDYTEGTYTLLDGMYTLETYYHGKLMNQTSLATSVYGNSTINILLQMKPHTSVSGGYIIFNNTITSITINSQTDTNLTVTVEGSSPTWIIADVPRNCTYVKRNGINQTGWIFLSDSPNYIHINASALSTWEFYFPIPPSKPGQILFSITSNSTISKVTFISENKTLDFIVSGPSGTTGYVEILVAKTIMNNVDDLRVYLDGVKINHTVTSIDNSWLIRIEYKHSIHHVRVIFGTQPIETQPIETLDYWVGVEHGLIVSVGLAVLLIILIKEVPRVRKVRGKKWQISV